MQAVPDPHTASPRFGESLPSVACALRLAGVLALALAAACATRPYRFEPVDSVGLESRALTRTEDDVQVSVAVPDAEETEAIFGVPMYERGIQPVWLKVVNRTDANFRFAPVGMDRNYFSPLEVPYMHRGGFSKAALEEMDLRFHDLAMERRIPARSTRSGFVFTNLSPGTKGVNVDLYGEDGTNATFTFFVDVPGFRPDHADVDFDHLYAPGEFVETDVAGLRSALAALPCCSTDESGTREGVPFTVVLVATGNDILYALLRAGWLETHRPKTTSELAKAHHMFGRPPDAVFRKLRSGPRGAAGSVERNELRVWLAPIHAEGQEVWVCQLTHYVGQRTQIGQFLVGSTIDPDIDNARDFMLQLMWYSQSLARMAWLGGGPVVDVETIRTDFNGDDWFADGSRVVLWLSGDPISLVEGDYVEWDEPPAYSTRPRGSP